MFYKVLFVLTIVMIIRDIKRYVKECKQYTAGDIPIILYVKIGVSALFYIMLMALLSRPYLLWLWW